MSSALVSLPCTAATCLVREENGRPEVEIGVDLTEFYMSVEWDILEVPAIRNVKYYTCCDEPYLDITFNVTMRYQFKKSIDFPKYLNFK